VSAAQTAAGYALSGVFLLAAFGKARAVGVFREQIADYRLLPYRLTGVAGVLITFAEASAAVLLFIPEGHRLGSAAAVALLAVFVAAQLSARMRGRVISCGCLGGSGDLDQVNAASVVRTGLLLVFGVTALLAPGGPHHGFGAVGLAALMTVSVFLVAEEARLLGDLRRRAGGLTAGLQQQNVTQAEG
jgi:hypothetical protein